MMPGFHGCQVSKDCLGFQGNPEYQNFKDIKDVKYMQIVNDVKDVIE